MRREVGTGSGSEEWCTQWKVPTIAGLNRRVCVSELFIAGAGSERPHIGLCIRRKYRYGNQTSQFLPMLVAKSALLRS